MSAIDKEELKRQAQVKAIVLKLQRTFSKTLFIAKKDKRTNWYEIICNDFELYLEDEIFDDYKRELQQKLDFKLIFGYSSDPLVIGGNWVYKKV